MWCSCSVHIATQSAVVNENIFSLKSNFSFPNFKYIGILSFHIVVHIEKSKKQDLYVL